MITEDYVSYEIAKLLKEKGFDTPCRQAYFNGLLVDYTMYGFCDGELIDCPSQSLALKWLREVYNILIGITSYDGQPERLCLEVFHNGERLLCVDSPKKYEELVEEAIKMSLKNLI